jgi:predicted ATPase
MVRPPQQDFRDTKLDPDLLSSSFGIQTKWHVITGASSSGKTTMIDLLAGSGFQTIPEPGRQYFERELAKGWTIADIREDRAALTHHIYGLWLKLHSGLRASEVAFLDRGLPDSLAFYRFAGMNPNQILLDCFQHRYASVFMLNRLPYQQDGIRAGDDASAAYFESWMLRDYTALGYDVVRVPVLVPEERLAFILERLSEQGVM